MGVIIAKSDNFCKIYMDLVTKVVGFKLGCNLNLDDLPVIQINSGPVKVI